MTNLGSFDTWMADTQTAIELIVEVGNRVYTQYKYDSPEFSYVYDSDAKVRFYRYNRVILSGEEPNFTTRTAPHPVSTITSPYSTGTGITGVPVYGVPVSNQYVSTPGVNSIIIGVDSSAKIASIVWVRKPHSDLVLMSNNEPSFGKMHGGTVRTSMLFLEKNKILVDGKVYGNDNPDAFNHDIANETNNIRYLDLLNLRERYNEPLFK